MTIPRSASGDLDQTFVALADSTRRAILDRLSRGEARVTDLAAGFPISLNSVSKHIRLLERARLVRRRVVGRNHFLAVRPGSLEAAQAWIAQKTAFWQMQLEALDRELRVEPRKTGWTGHG
jgi:DNA-binding transcriptional ArsR family regulator